MQPPFAMRVDCDDQLAPHSERVCHANMQGHGADKVWPQLARKGTVVDDSTVEQFDAQARGRAARCDAMRGRVVRTTISDRKAALLVDRVNRQFRAEGPNQLCGSRTSPTGRPRQRWLYVMAAGNGCRERRNQLVYPTYPEPVVASVCANQGGVLGHHQVDGSREVHVLSRMVDAGHLRPLCRGLAAHRARKRRVG